MWRTTSAFMWPRSDAASCDLPAALRHRRDSYLTHDDVSGLFFEFEALRTASSEYDAPRMTRSPRSCRRDPRRVPARAGLANSVRKECKAAGIVDTSANLWKFYVNKCRNNLHLVLAMSPSGDKLRLRCRSFPGLISNCVIDWFFAWPASVRKSMFHFTDTTRGHRTMTFYAQAGRRFI